MDSSSTFEYVSKSWPHVCVHDLREQINEKINSFGSCEGNRAYSSYFGVHVSMIGDVKRNRMNYFENLEGPVRNG